MCAHVCVCALTIAFMYICVYMRVRFVCVWCVYLRVYVYLCVFECVHMSVFLCVSMCACMYMCVYVCVRLCVCASVYVHVLVKGYECKMMSGFWTSQVHATGNTAFSVKKMLLISGFGT